MKRLPCILVFAFLAAAAAFALTRRYADAPPGDEMTWLREEFALTPTQTAAIERLHREYEPVCADHCARIAVARRQLHQAETAADTAPDQRAAAEREWAALADECTRATRAHLVAVAAEMSPEQGKRYLELVGPKLTRRNPGVPFGLR